MSGFTVFLIVIILIFFNSGKKEARRKKAEEAHRRKVSQSSSYDDSQRREKTPNRMLTSSNTITKRITDEEKEEPSAIEKRRMEQHESHMDKRIHRNVHATEDETMNEESLEFMMHVRDLIVCGYPTEIPGQRDFVKEGEDFLANLGSDSLFL